MKCSNCGREFGEGLNCQYCGIDRVTGLGNYSGYDRPFGGYKPQYGSSNNGGYSPNTMVCYICSEIIPANSVYCPVCGRQLLVECPNCGSTYSSQYKICSKCGTNRDVYYKQKEAEKQRAIREEEEKQRKQREWLQSPEGQAELERENNKEDRIITLSVIISLGVYFILFFLLDSWIDKNWLNIVLVGEITIRLLIIFCISTIVLFINIYVLLKLMDIRIL